jgi:hypothetical protein
MIIASTSSFKGIYPFFTFAGKKNWVHIQGDVYVVTGIDCSRIRFQVFTQNWLHAKSINVFRGTRWLLRGGKRWMIERVFN